MAVFPLKGKFTMFAGDSGSGKSYIVSGNIIKDCQEGHPSRSVIDTENALDESWLQALGRQDRATRHRQDQRRNHRRRHADDA
jgi:RecA/RadA recombinase